MPILLLLFPSSLWFGGLLHRHSRGNAFIVGTIYLQQQRHLPRMQQPHPQAFRPA